MEPLTFTGTLVKQPEIRQTRERTLTVERLDGDGEGERSPRAPHPLARLHRLLPHAPRASRRRGQAVPLHRLES